MYFEADSLVLLHKVLNDMGIGTSVSFSKFYTIHSIRKLLYYKE